MQVNVTLKKPGTKLEHQGIKIELIGEFSCEFLCQFSHCNIIAGIQLQVKLNCSTIAAITMNF